MEENFHIQSSPNVFKNSRTNFLCNGLARIGAESQLGRRNRQTGADLTPAYPADPIL
jgi:hypothetical protein